MSWKMSSLDTCRQTGATVPQAYMHMKRLAHVSQHELKLGVGAILVLA